MTSRKNVKKFFNSKNIVLLIEKLIDSGKTDLALQILSLDKLKGLLPNVLEILKRKSVRLSEEEKTKIFSKTDLDEKTVQNILNALGLGTSQKKIIIDKEMGAGVKVKTRNRLLDASLDTMLKNGVEELLGITKS